MIKNYKEGDSLLTNVLINNVNKCLNNNGVNYLNLELRDASGTINAKKWEIVGDDEQTFVVGNVVKVRIDVIKYKDGLQCKIHSGTKLEEGEYDIQDFLKPSPIPKEELEEKLKKYISQIENEDCLKLLNHFLEKYKDVFYIYPAASSIHHEYRSGLLMHVTSMLELAEKVISMYKDINKDIVYTGIILHDVGKLFELKGPVIFHYSTEGKLLGHISIMMGELRKACEQLNINKDIEIQLEHIILSHHGEHDYGSPVLPLTLEAMVVHLLDNLDSKLTILTKALQDTKKGDLTQKVFALDNRQFMKF